MKKTFLKMALTVVMTVIIFALSFSATAALTGTDCIGESIEVSTFAEFRSALENYTPLSNIVLKGNITVNDDVNSCTVSVTGSGVVSVDLNGYKLTVNSKATKYLFNITGQTSLYFLNSKSNRGAVIFNTTQPGAAAVRVSHSFAEIYNINADFTMGTAYKAAADSSDTYVFRIDCATEMNIFGGIIHNEMVNGNGVYVASDDRNRQRLSLRVSGEIEAYKYCIEFDPGYVYYEKFGSVRLESINSNKGLYERVKVPSTSTATLNDLWYTSGAGTTATIYLNEAVTLNHNQKIKDISKVDIRVNKTCCDGLSNADDFVLLRCAGGHIKVCGSCGLKFRFVDTHQFQRQIGVAASCTTNGKTTGEKCTECRYSTSKTIPKTGHKITYVAGKAASCGVDGIKAHYYCADCKSYFSDSAGSNKVTEESLVIRNNHNIEHRAAVSATCTKNGLTAGIYCYTCKKHILKQETVPSKGHDYPDSWSVKLYPNCEFEGTKIKVCSRCGATQEMSIPKTAHTDGDENGKCDFCGKKLTASDPVAPNGPEYPGDSDSAVKNCSCNCHAKGIKNFFFKIGLFFQRIFRANKVCKCGINHY